MKAISARNPVFSSNDNSTIDLIVVFDELGEVPFTANPNDVVDYSRDLFHAALSGSFGPVAPYCPPSIEGLSSIERSNRNRLLIESDWTQLPDVPQSIKNSWSAYRQALRDVPQQSGFPLSIVWPEKPQ